MVSFDSVGSCLVMVNYHIVVLSENLLVAGISILNSDLKSRINTIFRPLASYIIYDSEGVVQA
jgi:hypothetical protein